MKYFKLSVLAMILCACGTPSEDEYQLSKEDLAVVVDSIARLMATYHYNPSLLETEEYLHMTEKMQDLASKDQTKEEFASGFGTLWQNGPFSHVALGISNMKSDDMAEYFDTLRVGEQSTSLQWFGTTALMTVNTMMGLDTYDGITEMYSDIADKDANALIIDVRKNPGGAFAIVPLVGHLLSEPMDAGFFVSRKWWSEKVSTPDPELIGGLSPWAGWSLRAFWHDVQGEPLMRIQFKPMQPYYDGPVYVLVSNKSASATEFAIDALANLENVTIIGETTAGEMLSQKMYDLPFGFQLSLPIAEYYSTRIGRIEGKGVSPDMEVDASVARELAMLLIEGETPADALTKARLAIGTADQPTLGDQVIYLFGTMNDWGKQWNGTPKFEYIENGIYEASTTLEQGKYEFKIAPMDWSFDYGASRDTNVVPGEEKLVARMPGSKNLEILIEKTTTLKFRLDLSQEDEPKLNVSAY